MPEAIGLLPVVYAVQAAAGRPDDGLGVVEVDTGGKMPSVGQHRNGAQLVIADDFPVLQIHHGFVKRRADGVQTLRSCEPDNADVSFLCKAEECLISHGILTPFQRKIRVFDIILTFCGMAGNVEVSKSPLGRCAKFWKTYRKKPRRFRPQTKKDSRHSREPFWILWLSALLPEQVKHAVEEAADGFHDVLDGLFHSTCKAGELILRVRKLA